MEIKNAFQLYKGEHMKKVMSVLLVAVVGAGSYLGYTMYEQSNSKHSSKPVSGIAMAAEKQPASHYKELKPENFTFNLIDARTGQTIRTFQPVHFDDKSTYEDTIKHLASDLADKYDTPMENAKMDANGNLVGGHKRVVLKEKELVSRLKDLHIYARNIQVPIEETEPNVTLETAKGINEVVIGSYKTGFNVHDTGRNRNVELSALAINNIILGPGDTFSYNETVGERTAARGYQPAHEIVNKELTMGIGGGICQTSSTLFNAIDLAGLEVVTRTNHSKQVGYVPKGRDATVSWGGPDFKFKNPRSYPVLIKTVMDKQNGSLTVEVRTAKRYTL